MINAPNHLVTLTALHGDHQRPNAFTEETTRRVGHGASRRCHRCKRWHHKGARSRSSQRLVGLQLYMRTATSRAAGGRAASFPPRCGEAVLGLLAGTALPKEALDIVQRRLTKELVDPSLPVGALEKP